MPYSRRSEDSRSPSPYGRYRRSVSRSLSRSRSRSRESSAENPGNTLYVTGLSARVTRRDLEKHFACEGKVVDSHLVTDPWTKEPRGFGFVTMSGLKEANRCVKYLNRSVLEGRVITVEKSRRSRGRTPTPGRYLGLRTSRGSRHSSSYSPDGRRTGSRHSSSYSPDGRRTARYSSDRERSYSPYNRRGDRSESPYCYRDRRSYSPYYTRQGRRSRSRSRSPYYSRSPVCRRSRYDYSPDDRYYRRNLYRSYSRSYSPRGRSYSPSSPRRHARSYSTRSRRSSRRSYSRSLSRSPGTYYSHKKRDRSRDSWSSGSYSSGDAPSRSRSLGSPSPST